MTDLFDPLPAAPAVRRRENTRSRLVRASLAVFVDKGIDGATIDDLVTAAGFTRGALGGRGSTTGSSCRATRGSLTPTRAPCARA